MKVVYGRVFSTCQIIYKDQCPSLFLSLAKISPNPSGLQTKISYSIDFYDITHLKSLIKSWAGTVIILPPEKKMQNDLFLVI